MNVQYIKMLGWCHCCHRRSLTGNYNSIHTLAAGNHSFMQDDDWLLLGNCRYKGNGKCEIKVKLMLVNREDLPRKKEVNRDLSGYFQCFINETRLPSNDRIRIGHLRAAPVLKGKFVGMFERQI